MRIAIDISQIVYGTGVSVYTRNLVTHLVKNYPNDQYLLYANSFRRANEIKQFVERLKVESKIFKVPPTLMDLLWNSFHILPIENLIGKVDIIHTSDWTEPPSKIPKVTTIHDLIPLKYPSTTTAKIRSTHRKKLSWVIRESSKILAVSESTKRDLIETLKIDSNRIVVSQEGVEPFFNPQQPDRVESVKKKYGIDSEYLFTLSTIEPRKNVNRLIDAFHALKKNFPNLKLLIAGRAGWENLQNLTPDIITPGFIPDADLPALFSGCLVFVFPSLYEGFGLPVLQAMSCGAPVVASKLSSMPEVVGNAGVLVDPLNIDEISKGIILAASNRRSLTQKSIKRASLFSWDETSRITHQTYQEVLKSKT